MSDWGARGRVVLLFAASFAVWLSFGLAPARAAVFNPFYQLSASSSFDRPIYNYAVPAPFMMPLPPASEPFRAELGFADNKSLSLKWGGVKRGLHRDQIVLQHCREDASACPAAAKKFLAIVERAQGRSGWSRIAEVNRSINLNIRAVSDVEQYGVRDRWATPVMMFTSSAGDCEDLAIAKYAALRELGYTEDDLRLIIVNDNDAGEVHAVAAVRHEGRWLVLDNKTLEIRDDEAIAALDPLFMIGRYGVRKITSRAAQPERAPWTEVKTSPVPAYIPSSWLSASPSL